MLFEHDWADGPPEIATNNPGDGLGPVYNGTSCVDCHFISGTGGAGPAEKNVTLLSLVLADRSDSRVASTVRHGRAFHPGFSKAKTNLVFHRYANTVGGVSRDYHEFRDDILNVTGAKPMSVERPVRKFARVSLRLSERNTPSLFGAGLINSVPVSALVRIAGKQRREHPRSAGRIGRDPSGKAGRFGWRAQVSTLFDFVQEACANELGLEVPGHHQAFHPLGPTPRAVDIERLRIDLTTSQCADMTAYVRSLPRPMRQFPKDEGRSSEGEELFGKIGCAVCHQPSLENAPEIYSDLLLHDMGEALSDPIAAEPVRDVSESRTPVRTGNAYSGSARRLAQRFSQPRSKRKSGRGEPKRLPIDSAKLTHLWRTPPLWGVRDSDPYLHDGRAATLDEAIRQHGGQGAAAATAYAELSVVDQRLVIAFLNTLAAPKTDAGE